MSQKGEQSQQQSPIGQEEGNPQNLVETPRTGRVEDLIQQLERLSQAQSPDLGSPGRVTRSQTGSLPGQR